MLLSEKLLSEGKFTNALKTGALAASIALSPLHAQTTEISNHDISNAAEKISSFLIDQQALPNYQTNSQFVEDTKAFAVIALAAHDMQTSDTDVITIGDAKLSKSKLNLLYNNALMKLRKNYKIDRPEEFMSVIQDIVFDK